MKTKKGFPFLSFFIAAGVSTAILLPLRVFQYLKVLEQGTGFYEKIDFSVYLLYAIIAFVVIYSIGISFFNKKNFVNEINDYTVFCSIGFGIGGLGFVADAATKAMDIVDIYSSYAQYPAMDFSKYLSSSNGTIYFGEMIFAIISAVYFFTLCASGFSKKDVSYSLRILALAPSIWAAIRLLFKFKSTISFTNVSDLLLELFAIVFLMIFFYAFAQTNSKIDKGESYWKLFAYGIPGAVFSLSCVIPRLIMILADKKDYLAQEHMPEICDLAIAFMILIYLVSKASVSQNKRA